MSSNPKIIVLKTREIIYTLLLILFVLMLILCLVLMFSGHGNRTDSGQNQSAYQPPTTETESSGTQTASSESESASTYTPGIYTTAVTLGESSAIVEVTVDSNHINSIRLVNLSETAAAAFPLVTPSLEHIASQILEKQTLEGITCPQENRYTSQLLLSAVAEALELASAA